MGYSEEQLAELRATINQAEVDIVIAGTPIDLARDAGVTTKVVRAHYNYSDAGEPALIDLVESALAQQIS